MFKTNKSISKVYIVESLAVSRSHEIINSALTLMLYRLFDNVCLVATKESKKDIFMTLKRYGYSDILKNIKTKEYKVNPEKKQTKKRVKLKLLKR